jgi:hypothetical protein
MGNYLFPIRKEELFDSTSRSPPSERLRGPTRFARCRPGKEIEELRGGIHRYAAQAGPEIDAAWPEKNPFRTEII